MTSSLIGTSGGVGIGGKANDVALEGRIRKSRVTIVRGTRKLPGHRWTMIVINCDIPTSLNIGPERVLGRLLKTVRGGDVQTGDDG